MEQPLAPPIMIQQQKLPPAILPERMAVVVSTLSYSSKVSLTLWATILHSLLDASRSTALASITITGRLVESILEQTEHDVPDGKLWVSRSINAVHNSTLIARIFTSASFRFASCSVNTLNSLARSTIHLFDGVFGSTDSSRVLASIVALFQNELKRPDSIPLAHLMFSIVTFSVLQTRCWNQISKSFKIRPVLTVAALESGEIFVEFSDLNRFSVQQPMIMDHDDSTSSSSSKSFSSDSPIKVSFSEPHPQQSLVRGLENSAIAYRLRRQQRSTSSSSSTNGAIDCSHSLSYVVRYVRFASACYGQGFMRFFGIGMADRYFPTTEGHHGEHHAFSHHTGVPLESILLSSFTDPCVSIDGSNPLVFFLALDEAAQAVVLTIRGTLGFSDILTDLSCDYQSFEWHGKTFQAHRGMLTCAMKLLTSDNRVMSAIKEAFDNLDSQYGLILCGHSLGGGIAAILSILLSTKVNKRFVTVDNVADSMAGRPIHCYAYGTPSIICTHLRAETMDLITSVIYGYDIIPTLSLGTLRDVQEMAKKLKSNHPQLIKQVGSRTFAKLAAQGKVFESLDDEYLWSVLCDLRSSMTAERLVSPGTIYHVSASTVFRNHNNYTRKAIKVTANIVLDAEKRFGEPLFSKGFSHHNLVYYEHALHVVAQGLAASSE